MLPQNILQLYGVIQFAGRAGLLITILYPGMLLVIDLIRNRRKKKNEVEQS